MGQTRYLSPGPLQRALGLYCLGAGIQSGPLPAVAARRLDCYAAVSVSHGSGSLVTGGRTIKLTGPALFWLFPGVEHSYRPDRSGWNEQWVLFAGTVADTYRDLGILDPRAPAHQPPSTAAAAATMTELVSVVLADDLRRFPETTGLLHLLIARANPRQSPSSPAERAVALLREHAAESISVDSHAQRAGLTAAEFRQAVRQVAAATPKELILRFRIERAQLLLTQTSRTVASISAEVGYSDAGYFSRLFTHRTGMPPSEFRAQQQR